MNAPDTAVKYRAPALDKGLDILELLAAQPAGMTRGEIVRALDRGPSEIYRMIERLVARGYVGRSVEGDRYALTIKLFQLGSAFPPLRRLVAQAQPLMDLFAQDTGQSVHLVTPDLGQSYVVAQASSSSPWEFRLRLGAELDLFTTGSGQTLLAFMTPAQLEHTLNMRGGAEREIPSPLATALEEIRLAGYRMAPSQQLVGVSDISVPVATGGQDIVGVLTCPFLPLVGAKGSSVETQLADCLSALQNTANRIALI
ncbi:IclR family transcriptional regulator [Yoonia sp. BS5-3]|uniref:IclR family transcriptional regulator n=1 Tax=Yoonia phaeophyticola TaxID=3137369 RepID=A0ABZ2VBM5_9RHOB